MTYPNALQPFPADGEHDRNPGRRTTTSNSADGQWARESDKSFQYRWCPTHGWIVSQPQSQKQVLPAPGILTGKLPCIAQQMWSPVKALGLTKTTHSPLRKGEAVSSRCSPSCGGPFATSPSLRLRPLRPGRSPRPRGAACIHRRSGRAPLRTPYRQWCP